MASPQLALPMALALQRLRASEYYSVLHALVTCRVPCMPAALEKASSLSIHEDISKSMQKMLAYSTAIQVYHANDCQHVYQ